MKEGVWENGAFIEQGKKQKFKKQYTISQYNLFNENQPFIIVIKYLSYYQFQSRFLQLYYHHQLQQKNHCLHFLIYYLFDLNLVDYQLNLLYFYL